MPKIADVKRQRDRKDPLPECGHRHPGGVHCAEPKDHSGDHEPPIQVDLNGSCKTANLVGSGVIGSTTTAEEWHALCPVAIIDGRGVVIRCTCPCHEVHTVCLRCALVTDDLDQTTLRCLDEDACTERFQAALDANPRYQKMKQIREQADAETKADARPRERKTKAGRCHHCGEPTKGGKFLAGHDMKLKGELIRASQEGDSHACAELMARGWHKDFHSDARTELEADKIIQGTPTHLYIQTRNETRWAK